MNKQSEDGHVQVEVELSLEEVSMLRYASTTVGMNVVSFISLLTHRYLNTEGEVTLKYFKGIEESISSVEV